VKMIEKYYIFECGRNTFIFQRHAAVAMVTFSVTL